MSFVAQVIQKDLAVVKDEAGRIVATCVLHGGLRFTSAALAQLATACEAATGLSDGPLRQSLEEWVTARLGEPICPHADKPAKPIGEWRRPEVPRAK